MGRWVDGRWAPGLVPISSLLQPHLHVSGQAAVAPVGQRAFEASSCRETAGWPTPSDQRESTTHLVLVHQSRWKCFQVAKSREVSSLLMPV